MTASVPSRTALATSLASARVGRGEFCMEASICVAVITSLPDRRASWMTRFWMMGTSARGISTPRSPLATITPSTTENMPARLSRASGFSILAISRGGR